MASRQKVQLEPLNMYRYKARI